MIEHFFTCPFCWENISMLLERSNELQSYIEEINSLGIHISDKQEGEFKLEIKYIKAIF